MKNPNLHFTMHTPLLRKLRVLFLPLLAATALHAQVATLLNYQGRVAVDAVNFEGAGIFTGTGNAELVSHAMSYADVAPGTVAVIDAKNPGKLRRSAAAYDKKVAGIVSGANGVRPGISMIQEDLSKRAKTSR